MDVPVCQNEAVHVFWQSHSNPGNLRKSMCTVCAPQLHTVWQLIMNLLWINMRFINFKCWGSIVAQHNRLWIMLFSVNYLFFTSVEFVWMTGGLWRGISIKCLPVPFSFVCFCVKLFKIKKKKQHGYTAAWLGLHRCVSWITLNNHLCDCAMEPPTAPRACKDTFPSWYPLRKVD